MGVWGYRLFQNDVASDLKADFLNLLRMGKAKDEIVAEITRLNIRIQNDPDDGPVFWIAFATLLWEYSMPSAEILSIAKAQAAMLKARYNINSVVSDQYRAMHRNAVQCVERLNEPNPNPKTLVLHRSYVTPWKEGDIYALRLESNYAIEKGLAGQYLIFHMVGKSLHFSPHIIPVCRVKITTNAFLPQTKEDLDELEYVLIGVDAHNRGQLFMDGTKIRENEWVDKYPQYVLGLMTTSARMVPKKLICLGNDSSISPPKLEYRLDNLSDSTPCMWKFVERKIIDNYFGLNKMQAERYRHNKGTQSSV
jgi:hypothetical protein